MFFVRIFNLIIFFYLNIHHTNSKTFKSDKDRRKRGHQIIKHTKKATFAPTTAPSIYTTRSALPSLSPSSKSLSSSSPSQAKTIVPTQTLTTSKPTMSSSTSQSKSYDNTIFESKSTTSHPFCSSTNGSQVVFSSTNICQAYIIIKPAFVKLLPTANDILGRGKLFGSAVRLAFHDAGEYDIRTSDLLGPDGCLSHGPNNRGLQEDTSIVMTVLEPLWQKVCQYITRADFWVMFAKLVIEEATSHSITIAYQYGRHDKSECSVGANRLPSGQSGLIDIERIFVTQLGLEIKDAGAHSLGYVNISNSGYGLVSSSSVNSIFTNAWDSTPHILDNKYFTELITKDWKNVPCPVIGQSQWIASQAPIIMINPDLSLAYSIDYINNSHNNTVVQRQTCGKSSSSSSSTYPGCLNPKTTIPPITYNQVLSYTLNNSKFLSDFKFSFTKMTTVGYPGKLGILTSIDLTTCQ